jgi:glucose/arabinose dehydrogenase
VSALAVRASGLALALSAVMLAALTLAAAPAVAEPALLKGFQDEVVFDGLEQPTNFRFAPDGRVFVAEKPGKIQVFDSLADPAPEVFADLRTDVYDEGDRGLLGIALDPEFATGRPYVYALYTYDHILGDGAPAPKWGTPDITGDLCPDFNGGDACLVSGRLVRLTAEGNHAKPSSAAPEQKVLAEGWCQQFSSHSIGDLHFGPDGALYVSGGDGASFSNADYGQFGTTTPNPCGDPPGGKGVALTPPTAAGGALRSQDMSLLNGKILRVDPDTGEGLIDNPMGTSLDQNTRRIVAAGFRNPFRFAFDPATDDLYTGNVGSSEIEELDRFETPPASLYNSGWPCYEGIERQFQYRELGLNLCKALYADEPDSASLPFFSYSHGQSVVPEDECGLEYGSAVGGVSFYESGPGADFPAGYDGAFFFADAVRGCVWVMYPGGDGRPDPATTARFMRESHVYPAVYIEQGPDGDLYYASLLGDENGAPGAIHRIFYNPGGPTARLEADPPYGVPLPLEVDFDASTSSDPDGEALKYDWDMNGDGAFELEGAGPTQSKSFTKAEQDQLKAEEKSLNPVVTVRVTDGEALSSVAKVTVYPGDSPPQVQITKPLPSSEWTVGQELKLDGSAKTSDGAEVLTPLPYYWTTKLAHCPTGPTTCHEHPLQTFSGIRHPEFLAPEHDFPSYIRIDLRVADERGLTGAATLNVYPKTTALQLKSSPAGIDLTAGLVHGLSPLGLTTLRGSNVLLSAPETAQVGGRTYSWKSWSDGGARSHLVLAGEDACYQAVYSSPEDSTVPGPCIPPPPVPPSAGPPDKPPPGSAPDVTAPSTTLATHPPKKTRKKIAKFGFATSEGGSSFRCKLDRAAAKPCRSPATYRGLKAGPHVFKVFATDASGNAGKAASFSWKVLAAKPRR